MSADDGDLGVQSRGNQQLFDRIRLGAVRVHAGMRIQNERGPLSGNHQMRTTSSIHATPAA
jgi:hypothetical protein